MPTPKDEKIVKTRKAPAKKKTAAAPPEPIEIRPSHDQIASLARKYWAERGYSDGHAEYDWLRAEQELMKVAS